MEKMPEDVSYRAILGHLAARGDEVMHFEIIPSGLGPIMIDHYNIGISKEALVQAFIAAKPLFFRLLKCSTDEEKEAAARTVLSFDEHARLNSEIILLYDSEHLSACNWRKRRLSDIKNNLRFDLEPARKYIAELRKELSFTTTLLNSSLFRHAKSPTIWQHRYWVIRRLFWVDCYSPLAWPPTKSALSFDELFEYGKQVLHRELLVVLRAGEQHPMNYYAFSFMRRFLSLLVCAVTLCPAVEMLTNSVVCEAALADNPGEGHNPKLKKSLAKEIIPKMSEWCQANPRDISGWSFLLDLLTTVDDPIIQRDVVGKTFKYALCITWTREGLWTFIDLAMSKFQIDTVHLPIPSGKEQQQGPIRASGTLSKPCGWKAWVDTIWPSLAYRPNDSTVVPC